LREESDQKADGKDRYLSEVVIETKLIGHFFKKISLGVPKLITTEYAKYLDQQQRSNFNGIPRQDSKN